MTARTSTIKDLEEFARENYNLIYHFAKSYLNDKRYEKEEVISAAQFGYVKALNGFDASKDIKFSTYASIIINNELNQYARSYRKTMRFGYMYSMEYEISDPKKEGGGSLLLETIAAPDKNSFEILITFEMVRKELSELKEKERRIFLKHLDGMKQKDIAEQEGISRSYVSRIVIRIQKHLREKVGYNDGFI